MKGILLIHGFCGTREELKPLSDYFKSKNYKVEVPLLTGHEQDCHALKKAKYTDWITDIHVSYENLAKQCEEITVIGFSMGGLLAAKLYETVPYHKLITINTPIYYWNLKLILKNSWKNPIKSVKKYCASGAKMPRSALIQFLKLLTISKGKFSNINCPALVIQTQNDETVNPKSAQFIFDSLKGPKQMLHPQNGGHVLFMCEDYQTILQNIEVFTLK